MPYGRTTNNYGIPIPLQGELLEESEEIKKMAIIDNQLRGAIVTFGNTVFEEGSYALTGSGPYTVTLSPSGGPSVRGILNNGFIEDYSSVVWSSIPDGQLSYLYLRYRAEQYESASTFDTVVSSIEVTGDTYLLMATLDATGVATLDTAPSGKSTSSGILAHINDSSDPHGSTLTQSILSILTELSVTLGVSKSLGVTQANAGATVSLLKLTNSSSQPDIEAVNDLLVKDQTLQAKLPGLARCIIPFRFADLAAAGADTIQFEVPSACYVEEVCGSVQGMTATSASIDVKEDGVSILTGALNVGAAPGTNVVDVPADQEIADGSSLSAVLTQVGAGATTGGVVAVTLSFRE